MISGASPVKVAGAFPEILFYSLARALSLSLYLVITDKNRTSICVLNLLRSYLLALFLSLILSLSPSLPLSVSRIIVQRSCPLVSI